MEIYVLHKDTVVLTTDDPELVAEFINRYRETGITDYSVGTILKGNNSITTTKATNLLRKGYVSQDKIRRTFGMPPKEQKHFSVEVVNW